MPYVERDQNGRIVALRQNATSDASAEMPLDHPDVVAFLAELDPHSDLVRMDIAFIRVIEDVIDLMITKNLIRLTDLPAPAQEKLNQRRNARNRATEFGLMDEPGGILLP